MENEKAQAVQPDDNDLRAQFLSLRKQVSTTLLLLIVVSGTFNIFLWREYRYAHAELTALRAQAGPGLMEYQKVLEPHMNEIVRRIAEYGRTNADFAPIMAKYRLTNSAPALPAAPAQPVTPAKK